MFPGGLALAEREEQAAVDAVRSVMRSKRLFRYYGASSTPLAGSKVEELEKRFARKTGAPHALAVNSGTSALTCGLVGLGIGPGDEVILPAYTWCSTASAVLAAGAVPVVAEVDESLTIDPADVVEKASPYTKAIVAVHMRGAPARMDRLLEIVGERDLALIEDVAQAAGGSFGDRSLGTLGDVGVFSFQMSKVITAGEGGILLARNGEVHRRSMLFHDAAAGLEMGVPATEWLAGLNLKMSELHAAVLLVQLERLDGLVARMRAHKRRLKERAGDSLRGKGITFRTVHDPAGDISTALIFFLPDVGRTGQLVSALADENIPASRLVQEPEDDQPDYVGLHAYPGWTPLLRRRSWSAYGGPWRWHPREVSYPDDAFPTTVDLLRRAVHIDVSPQLNDQQVEQMGDGIAHVVERLV